MFHIEQRIKRPLDHEGPFLMRRAGIVDMLSLPALGLLGRFLLFDGRRFRRSSQV